MSSELRRPAGIATLVVCFVMAVFAWGVVFYGHSFYLNALQQTKGWSASLISTAILGFWLSSIPGSLLTGYLIDRHGPGWVLAFGCLSVAGGVILLGRADGVAAMFIAYGMMGAGYPALATAGISAILAPHFAARFGFALGLALTGASIGGAAIPPLLVWLMEEYDFTFATTLIGAAMLLVLLPAVLIIGRGRARAASAERGGQVRSAVLAPLLGSAIFWWLAAATALGLGAQVGFLAHQIPMLAGELGISGAAIAVSATAMSAAVGRLAVGYLSGRVSLPRLAACCYLIQALGFMIILSADGAAMLYAGSVLAGFVVGAIVLLPPMLVRKAFGIENYGRNYATINVLIYIGAGAGPWLTGLLKDQSGGYAAALWLLAGMQIAAIAVCLASPLRRLK
jgi:MFS family permease